MKLSLVDLSPVPPGGTAVDAMRDTVALAQRAEELGYSRFWVAEHHGTSSNASSAPEVLIAQLGLRYCFAGFINPRAATLAAETYRSNFAPSPFPSGLTEPHVALAMNVTVGENDAEGDRLRATVELFYRQLRSGRLPQGSLPSADAAVSELGAVPIPAHKGASSHAPHPSTA